jgi:hypothetical protein
MQAIGFLGLSWQETVLSLVKKWLTGTPDYKIINTTIIDNVSRIYISEIAKGQNPITWATTNADILLNKMDSNSVGFTREIARQANTSFILTDRILRAIFYLSAIGKIPYAKYDPKGYEAQSKAVKKFSSEKSFFDKYLPSKKPLIIGSIIIAGIAGLYFITKGEKYFYLIGKQKGKTKK